MRALLCRIRGHRWRFAEFDPITITHAMHCVRCGSHGWPNIGTRGQR
jgi:hypothetical protein